MIRQKVRRALATLWRQHASPARLGLAVALGILIGSSPLFGFHTLISIGLAMLLRLNKFAVVLGSQVSTPPLILPLAYSALQVGSLLVDGRWLTVDFADLSGTSLPNFAARFALYWAVGGVIVGVALGAVGFLLTSRLARRRQARKKTETPLDPPPLSEPE